MQTRTAVRLAWVTFAFVVLFFIGSGLLGVLIEAGRSSPQWGALVQEASFLGAMLSFPVVGVLIAARRPDNVVGWIMLFIGVIWTGGSLAGLYAHYGLVTAPGSLPGAAVIAALSAPVWVPGIGLIGTFLILLFPDGRLPSRRWKPLAWLSGSVLIYLSVLIPVLPQSLDEVAGNPALPEIANPLGIEQLRPIVDLVLIPLALLPLCIVACAWSLVRRFRRADGRQRLQLKWLSTGAAVAAALYLITMIFSLARAGSWTGEDPAWLLVLQMLAVYSFALIAIAIGMAILRHRLYDIDVIINRALVYAALTAGIALLYLGGVLGIGGIVRATTGAADNGFAVAMSTLVVAAMFRPLRRRIQSFVDRRFYRHKYDAEQTLTALSARLRDELDLESLNAEVVEVVAQTMQPAHVSLWLKSGP